MDAKKGEVVLYVGLALTLLVLGSLAFLSMKPSLTGASISIQSHLAGHFPQMVAVQMINTSPGSSTSGGGFVVSTNLARNINGSALSYQNMSGTVGSFGFFNISLILNATHGNIVNVSFGWQLARSNGSYMNNATVRNSTFTNNPNQSSFTQQLSPLQLSNGIYNVTIFIENLTVDGTTVGEINLSAAFEVGIDTTPPNVTQFFLNDSYLVLNASNFTGGVVSFNVTANDSTLSIETIKVGITGGPLANQTNYTLVKNFSVYHAAVSLNSVLMDGFYTLIVYANDTVNNVNDSVANLSFRLDRTPPNVTNLFMNISNATNIGGGQDDAGGVVQINATLNDSTTSLDTVKFGFYNVANGSRWNITASRQGSYWTIDVEINRTCTGQHDLTVYGNDTLNNLNDTLSNTSFRVNRIGSPPTTPAQCEGSPSQPSSTSSDSGGRSRDTQEPTEEQPAQQQQQQQAQPSQVQQPPAPTAEQLAQQQQEEQREYFGQFVSAQVEEPATGEEAESGGAGEEGIATESIGETETETISITNSGSEPITVEPELVAAPPPPLPNPEEVRQKLQEELEAAHPEKSPDEIDQLVEEQLEALELQEQEDTQYLVGERYSLGGLLGGKAGLTGGAVAVKPPIQKLEPSRVKQSLSGISLTKKRITGKLLKTELEGLEEIVVPPGATVEKAIQVRRGLSLSPKPITIHFVSEGQKMLQKELSAGKVVAGGAVDVDQVANTFDLYFVLPPQEAAGIYQLELSIEKEVPSQRSLARRVLDFLTRQKKQTLYSELFGPFKIPAEQGYIFAQQFAYEERQYYGQATIVTKVYRENKVIAEQRYPVTLG